MESKREQALADLVSQYRELVQLHDQHKETHRVALCDMLAKEPGCTEPTHPDFALYKTLLAGAGAFELRDVVATALEPGPAFTSRKQLRDALQLAAISGSELDNDDARFMSMKYGFTAKIHISPATIPQIEPQESVKDAYYRIAQGTRTHGSQSSKYSKATSKNQHMAAHRRSERGCTLM